MIICYENDGRISNVVFDPTPAEMPAHFQSIGINFIQCDGEGIDAPSLLANCYVKDGEVIFRPDIEAVVSKTAIMADGEDVAEIAGLPPSVPVFVDGEQVVVDDGRLELTAEMPATFKIRIDHWPYMPWQTEIVAQ